MQKVINIEPTPNPDALKFVVKYPFGLPGARSFMDFGAAVGDPLAAALFALGNVCSVFYRDRFVTVNKEPSAAWKDLIDPIWDAIEETRPVEDTAGTGLGAGFDSGLGAAPGRDGLLQKIMQVVEDSIGPGLAGDGGGLEIISFDGSTLSIAYQGACGSCPEAGTSTLQFIEGLLRQEVSPDINVVMA